MAELLRCQYVIITGGKSCNGTPILTFPDTANFSQLTDDEYRKLVLYLTAVPTLQESDLGFVIVIDRRSDKWNSVKFVLDKIERYFPCTVSVAYVIRPENILQRAISGLSNTIFKDEFSFKVVICSNVYDLHAHVDANQLNTELGGTILYDHEVWFRHRLAVEKFSYKTQEISRRLRQFTQELQSTDLPNESLTCQKMLSNQRTDYNLLNDDLSSAAKIGEELLVNIRNSGGSAGSEVSCPDRVINVMAIERLLIQLEETERTFNNFWARHETRMTHCLKFRSFETQFKNLLATLNASFEQWSVTVELGNCVEKSEELLNRAKIAKEDTKNQIEKATQLIEIASQMVESEHYASEIIRPKCVELIRIKKRLAEAMEARLESLHKSNHLWLQLRKTNHWCDRGIELLSSKQIDCYKSKRDAQESLLDLQLFLGTFDANTVESLKDLSIISNIDVVPETKLLISQTNHWCDRGIELLSSKQIDCYKSKRDAQESLLDLQLFLGTFDANTVESLKDLSIISNIDVVPETKLLISQVVRRVDDVMLMCEKRKMSLKNFTSRPSKRRSSLERSQRSSLDRSQRSSLDRSQRSSLDRSQVSSPRNFILNTSIRSNHRNHSLDPSFQYYLDHRNCSLDPSIQSCLDHGNRLSYSSIQSLYNRHRSSDSSIQSCHKNHSSDPPIQPQLDYINRVSDPSVQPPDYINRVSNPSIQSLGLEPLNQPPRALDFINESPSSLSSMSSESSLTIISTSATDTSTFSSKRDHVLQELLSTERTYVNELCSILRGYKDEMAKPELQMMIPVELLGKSDILFGNMEEMFRFHNDVFLRDLEACINAPDLVGLCFIHRKDTFHNLYSQYCQNKSHSEELRMRIGDQNEFFKECQRRLGHKLPLSAYLLKPIQRITKYHLLLKDLLVCSDYHDVAGKIELEESVESMLSMLKCLNDSMHQVTIAGFLDKTSVTGKLLMQNSFKVWSEKKSVKDIRLQPAQRHLFLYEKILLFTKKSGKNAEREMYQFKNSLRMAEIGLTENLKGEARKFEIWTPCRQEAYTILCTDVETKETWVKKIKELLLNQFEYLKGQSIKKFSVNLEKNPSFEDLPPSLMKHKALRQTASWDLPGSSTSLNSSTNSSVDNSTILTSKTGSRNFENSEVSLDCCRGAVDENWSFSDCDSDENDFEYSLPNNSTVQGVKKYVVLSDYSAISSSEVSLKEGDFVNLIKIGCSGWWYVAVLGTIYEGWAPAAYLELVCKDSRTSSSLSLESSMVKLRHAHSRTSVNSSKSEDRKF